MLRLQLERDESEETVAHYTMGSGLEAMRRETSSFYHYNHLGTALALTGADEAVTDTYRHDAWGVLLGRTGSTVNPHTYVGRERYYRMPNAAMYHLGFRDYAQRVGRFVTLDAAPLLLRNYAYVESSPVRVTDPRGMFPQTPLSDFEWPEDLVDKLREGRTGNCYVDCMVWPTLGQYGACLAACKAGLSPYLWPVQLACTVVTTYREIWKSVASVFVGGAAGDCWNCLCGITQVADVAVPIPIIDVFDCICALDTICDKGPENVPISSAIIALDCVAPVANIPLPGSEIAIDAITFIAQQIEQGSPAATVPNSCCNCHDALRRQ
jgi:RHS repeat-associated protein